MQKASMHHSEQTNPKTDILIVDDMPMNLELLAQILEYAGYSVREALSGTLALAAVEQKIPDLILLDVRMPEMDGFEVCQQLTPFRLTWAVSSLLLFIVPGGGVYLRELRRGRKRGTTDVQSEPKDPYG